MSFKVNPESGDKNAKNSMENKSTNEKTETNFPFYTKNWFVLIMLFFFAPLGIFLLWRRKKWSKALKIILTALSLYWFMFVIFVDFPYAPESVSSDTTNSFITEQTENNEIYTENTLSETQTESDTSEFYTETETEKYSGSGSSGNNIQHTDSYTPATTEKSTVPATHPTPTGEKFVLNTNTKVYHRPTCRYVEKIKPENYLAASQVPANYRPCKVCNP